MQYPSRRRDRGSRQHAAGPAGGALHRAASTRADAVRAGHSGWGCESRTGQHIRESITDEPYMYQKALEISLG